MVTRQHHCVITFRIEASNTHVISCDCFALLAGTGTLRFSQYISLITRTQLYLMQKHISWGKKA